MEKSNGNTTANASPRKKDKRSIRTEAKVKECLLEMLGRSRFSNLTVSEVCREADITRVTFYQHYRSLADVLDQLLDDITQELGDVPLEMCEACAGTAASPPGEGRVWTGMPFCHFYASMNPYRVLLEDNAIAERLIERIVDNNLDAMMDALKQRVPSASVNRAQLRYFNIFRMSGCLAAAKAAKRSGYDWSLVQPTLDGAIAAAFETL